MMTRRDFLAGAAALSSSTAVSVAFNGRRLEAREVIARPIATGTQRIALDLAERPMALPCFGGKTLPLWTFQEGSLFPVVRMKLGQRLEAKFRNDLPRDGEFASIH